MIPLSASSITDLYLWPCLLLTMLYSVRTLINRGPDIAVFKDLFSESGFVVVAIFDTFCTFIKLASIQIVIINRLE